MGGGEGRGDRGGGSTATVGAINAVKRPLPRGVNTPKIPKGGRYCAAVRAPNSTIVLVEYHRPTLVPPETRGSGVVVYHAHVRA